MLPSANARNGTGDRRDAAFVFDEQVGVGAWIGGHGEFVFDRAGGVAEKLDFQMFAAFAAGGIGDSRPREVADVQAVVAIVGAAVGRLTNEDRVVAVFGNDDREERILFGEHGVVDGRELEAVFVENRRERIEISLAKSDAFDLDREPLAFFGVDAIIVGVFILQRAGDTDVLFDRLRFVEVIVGFLLLDTRKGADEEGAVIGNAAFGAHGCQVFAQSAVLGHIERDADF